MRLFLSLMASVALAGCMSNVQPPAAAPPDDAAGALAAVHAFHDALGAGDEAAATRLLAPDVVVFESGGAETLEQYASGHLKGDMAFMKAMQVQKLDEQQKVSGDLALVITRSRITGEYKGKKLDLFSTETMALRRQPEGWRIAHVHWSSRPAGKAH